MYGISSCILLSSVAALHFLKKGNHSNLVPALFANEFFVVSRR